jgi:hypothetical protein
MHNAFFDLWTFQFKKIKNWKNVDGVSYGVECTSQTVYCQSEVNIR